MYNVLEASSREEWGVLFENFDNHYLLLVTFEDEPETAYHYLMSDDVVTGEKEINISGRIEQ